MPEVEWGARAKAQLEAIDPTVADQLRNNAASILHHIPIEPDYPETEEGSEGEVMWHRGIDHESQHQGSADGDGPENYLYIYKSWSGDSHPEVPDPDFLIVAICSNDDLAAGVLKAAIDDLARR